MKCLIVVLGILAVGIICGSWIFIDQPDFDCQWGRGNNINQQLDNWRIETNQIKCAVNLEFAERLTREKIIEHINKYNRQMDDSLKHIIAGTIIEMTRRYDNLNVDIILAVATWESAKTWDPNIVSIAGAIGLMQIMSQTGFILARQEGLVNFSVLDLFDPVINIKLGCRYLSRLIDGYGSLEVALAAYNGGRYNARMFAMGDQERCHPQTWGYVPNVMRLINMIN